MILKAIKKKILLIYLLFLLGTTFGQKAVISTSKTNYFIEHLKNPIEAMVENTSCDSIFMVASSGLITKDGCEYILDSPVYPNVSLSLYKIENGDTSLVKNSKYRVMKYPEFEPCFCGFRGGDTEIERFKKLAPLAPYLVVQSSFLIEGFSARVVSFQLSVFRDGQIIYTEKIEGNKLTNKALEALAAAKKGDSISFYNIYAKYPMGEIRKMEKHFLVLTLK